MKKQKVFTSFKTGSFEDEKMDLHSWYISFGSCDIQQHSSISRGDKNKSKLYGWFSNCINIKCNLWDN